VVGPLQEAGTRAVGATLPQMLALAGALLAIVGDTRAAERWAKLNRRVGRLLGTLAGNDFRGDKQTRLQSSSKNGDP